MMRRAGDALPAASVGFIVLQELSECGSFAAVQRNKFAVVTADKCAVIIFRSGFKRSGEFRNIISADRSGNAFQRVDENLILPEIIRFHCGIQL